MDNSANSSAFKFGVNRKKFFVLAFDCGRNLMICPSLGSSRSMQSPSTTAKSPVISCPVISCPRDDGVLLSGAESTKTCLIKKGHFSGVESIVPHVDIVKSANVGLVSVEASSYRILLLSDNQDTCCTHTGALLKVLLSCCCFSVDTDDGYNSTF